MKNYNIFQEPNSWVVHLFDNNITCKCGCDNCRNSFSNLQVKSYKLRKDCETCSLEMTGWFNCYLSTDCNRCWKVKSQPWLELGVSGIPCQRFSHWANETWYIEWQSHTSARFTLWHYGMHAYCWIYLPATTYISLVW